MNNAQSRSRATQAVLNIAALVVTLVANTLATTLPLGGRTTAEISDSFNILFVPAGYVFSIWSLIYLSLIGFIVFQALPAQQNNSAVRATGWVFVLSCVANSLWIVSWHYGYYVLSLALMLSLLVSLIVIYRRLAVAGNPDTATRWFVRFPFSLYLGWISVATIANASAVFTDLGWDGSPLSPVTWTVVMIGVAAALSLLMSYRYRDLAYSGVLVWALIGILVKQADYTAIVAACVIAIITIVAGAVAWQRRTSELVLERVK